MYIVIELQTNADGSVGNLVYKFDEYEAACSKYHAILSAAAISALPCHAAVMLTNAGTLVKSDFYRHGGDVNE